MTDTEQLLVNLLQLEARKRHKTVRQFCLAKGISPASFSQYCNGKRDPKLSTFLSYLRKLDIEIGFKSGFDGTTSWMMVIDQLSMKIDVTDKKGKKN